MATKLQPGHSLTARISTTISNYEGSRDYDIEKNDVIDIDDIKGNVAYVYIDRYYHGLTPKFKMDVRDLIDLVQNKEVIVDHKTISLSDIKLVKAKDINEDSGDFYNKSTYTKDVIKSFDTLFQKLLQAPDIDRKELNKLTDILVKLKYKYINMTKKY